MLGTVLPQPATLNISCMEGSGDIDPTNTGPIKNPGEKSVQLPHWGKEDGYYLFQNRRISLHVGDKGEDRSLEMIRMVTVATLPRSNLPNFNQHPPQNLYTAPSPEEQASTGSHSHHPRKQPRPHGQSWNLR